MLSPETQTAWTEYLAAEESGIRTLFLARLDRFIELMLAEPYEVGREWAFEFAESLSDRDAKVLLRFPLFERVLVPLLAEGVLAEEPGCARWLEFYASLAVRSFHFPQLSILPEHLYWSTGLLLEAVRLDPDDRLARQRLVGEYAKEMYDTIHELPAGVLYRPSETGDEKWSGLLELLELLAEFKQHVERLGATEYDTWLIGM